MFYANIARKYNIANALAEATMSKNEIEIRKIIITT